MREYEKVTKSYETQELSKCTCDKCGAICTKTITDDYTSVNNTLLKLQPYYTGDHNITLDLCPKCTRELLAWFPMNDDIEDFLMLLDVWESED